MTKVNFCKMSGAGNDFIVIDSDVEKLFEADQQIIRKLCHRRNGIGADGLITVKKDDKTDFTMSYYNADGSTGSLCGNGARCAIKFANITGKFNTSSTTFSSLGESFSGELINDDTIKFFLNSPKNFILDSKIKVAGQLINASFVNTGTPHLIIKSSEVLKDLSNPESFYIIDDLPVVELGRLIRHHEDFTPDGVNVNFVEIKDDKIFIRTYERGVEDETLACGTGSTAAAIILYITDKLKPPINLVTRGGEPLTVNFEEKDNTFYNLSLTGPAKVTFTGSFSLNNFI
ncbi:MAG: diaminopimelate epimerase [Ignavibacteriaceae bacterium]|nr:diaminopimelate epimerase [Ignavibacteriaceae bacterium]